MERSDQGELPYPPSGVNREEAFAIVRGVGAAWVNVVVGLLAAPIQTAIVLRSLSTSDSGLWLVVLSFAGYLALFDLGVGPTLTRSVALLRGDAGRGALNGTLPPALTRSSQAELSGSALLLYGVLAVVMLLVGAVGGLRMLAWSLQRPLAPEAGSAWLLFVLGCTATLVGGWPFALLAGRGVVGVGQLARAGSQVAVVLGSAIAVRLGAGVRGLAIAWLVQGLLFTLSGLWFLRRLVPANHRLGRPRWRIVQAMLGPSLRWTGTSIGSVALFSSGTAIVSRHLGAGAVPLFAAPFQLFGSLRSMALIPMGAAVPFASRVFGAGDIAGVRTLFRHALRPTLVPLIAGVALLASFGDDIIAVWVGSQHFGGWALFWVFSASAVVEAHYIAHTAFVTATGRVAFMELTMLAAVIGIAAASVLVPRFGPLGMAASLAGAQLITVGWFAPWYGLRRLRWRWREYFRDNRAIIFYLFGALATGALARVVANAVAPPPGVRHGLAGIAVFAGVLGPLAYVSLLESGERARLHEWVRTRLRGRTAVLPPVDTVEDAM